MSDSQISPGAVARHETHKEYFYKLCEIKEGAERLRTPTLDDDQLQSLCIQQLGNLDVDEASCCDFEPRYFVPFPTIRLADIIEQVQEYGDEWRTQCQRHTEGEEQLWKTDPFHPSGWCNAFHEALARSRWLRHAFLSWHCDSGTIHETKWHPVDMNGRNQLPFFEGYIRQYNPEGLGPAECPVFKAETAFAVLDETVPHMTCDIADSIVAGTKVLRSEIVTAATLIKRQLRKPCWDDHHTIPVLVVSFQHDCAARITQAHFDGNRMFIRQSRQLNLAGDEPTDDAYLLMRWMAGSPIGNTTYASSDPVGEAARNQNARIQSDNTVAITV